MAKKHKKIIIFAVLLIAVISTLIVFAATRYPYAKVSFTGITIVKNGDTTQGFIDITLKNIDAKGVSLCLEYDTDYLQLSDVDTNIPIQNPAGSINIEHKYFEQNTEAFPLGSLKELPFDPSAPQELLASWPIIGIADQDNSKDKGYLKMNFAGAEQLNDGSVPPASDYIAKDDHGDPIIISETKGDAKFGRISFRINKPTELAKLTEEEMKNVIKIVPFSTMMEQASPIVGNDTGVALMYIDEEDFIRYYTGAERYIDYDLDIKARLEDVKPQVSELTVSSYEIYKNNSVDDLFDFINEKMSMLTLSYADSSEVPEKFVWDSANSTVSQVWDAKGGDYTVKQKYNDDFDIEVTVHVTPVTLTGFDVDKQNITYLRGAENFPEQFGDLELPTEAKPIFDTYLPNGGIKNPKITWYLLDGETVELKELPVGFASDQTDDYSYKIHCYTGISEADLKTENPWLTIDTLPQINVMRNIVSDESNMPKKLIVESAETDAEGGDLTIVVKYDGAPIVDGTTFTIKMPGGDIIDTDALADKYIVEISAGKATITLAPDIAIASDTETDAAKKKEKKLAQLINLGNRAGNFSIAATEPDKLMGEFTDFSPLPRHNKYLSPDYELDYSTSLAPMFPIKAGVDLPKTITVMPPSKAIGTTYSGYDGDEPGSLTTFEVESWTITDGDKNIPGRIVTAVGRLKETDYTNYGHVYNDDNVMVTIKYCVLENDDIDSIDDILYTVFDKRQEGYGYDELQTKSFTVHNTGTTDIYGLSAKISLSAGSNKETFVITKELPKILSKGESCDFDITTKIGLPVLGDDESTTYTCTVSILSDNSTNPLKTFNISFTVTKQPVYNIKLTIDDDQKDFGTAKTSPDETYTATEGEIITIVAEPKEDCEFIEWTVVQQPDDENPPSVVFDDATSSTAQFTMPGEDVEIKASFKEKLGAMLRATELYVKDLEEKEQALHDDKWNVVQFDPVKREYYVAVSNDIEKVKLHFKLREEADNATLTLTNEHGGVTDTFASPTRASQDDYFISEEIPLESPSENKVVLGITLEDRDNFPDEDEQTKYYTIHIYRKVKASELISFDYGNSPYGMIMRDTLLNDTQKDAYKQEFTNQGYMFTAGNTPQGVSEGDRYSPKAWKTVNYDLDPVALFVTNTESFVDPGYTSVKNSLGDTVSDNDVSKSIKVNILAEPDASLQNGSSDDFIYVTSEKVDIPSSGQITGLVNKRIRPDKYEIVYSFTDFDGTTAEVSKPIIVLSPIGDINVDGSANNTDVSRVLHRFTTDIANDNNVDTTYENGGLLFKYRVCDVNKDGYFNAIDANNIRANELKSFYSRLS